MLSLQRELEELQNKLDDADRLRKSQTSELEDLMANKDDVGKNIHELEKGRRMLEDKVEEQRLQIEELEDEYQVCIMWACNGFCCVQDLITREHEYHTIKLGFIVQIL